MVWTSKPRVARQIGLLLLLLMGAASSAHASSSGFTVQGLLRSSGGAKLPDGNYSMQFALTDTTSSTVVWTKSIASVSLTNGVFSAFLSGADDSAVDLETAMGSAPVFTGTGNNRMTVTVKVDSMGIGAYTDTFSGITASTAPFAMNADRAYSVIASGVGTSAIADGAVTLAKISTTGASTGDVIQYDGSNWVLNTVTASFTDPGTGGSSEHFGASSLAGGTNSVSLGNAASSAGNSSVAIGQAASAGNASDIVLGAGAASTAANQFVAGSSLAPINNVYFGQGVSSAAPTSTTINSTSSTAAGVVGGDLDLAAGLGGNAATAGGNINFETAAAGTGTTLGTRMTILSGGNVGIGTTSPAGTLDVEGGTAASGTGSSINIVAQNGAAGTHGGGSINLTPGNGTGGATPGSLNLNLAGSGVSTLSINTGDPGGTPYAASSSASTSPSSQVILNPNTNIDGAYGFYSFAVTNTATTIQHGYFGTISTTGSTNYSPAFVWGEQTGANAYSERMRLDQNGNVGIGTTTPTADLHIYDTNVPASGGPKEITIGRDLSNSSTGGSIDFEFKWTPSNQYYTQARILSLDSSGYGGNLAFFTKPNDNSHSATPGGAGSDTSVERMRITNLGNVGIGTSSPAQPLSVAGTIESTSGGFKFPDGTTQITANGSGGVTQWTTSGTEIFYNGGNIGIGTATPHNLLTLGAGGWNFSPRQAIQINEQGIDLPTADGTDSNGDKLVLWNVYNAGLGQGVKHAIGVGPFSLWFQASGNSNAYMAFYTGPTEGAAPSERMRIDSGGKVGIGTTTPGTELQVGNSGDGTVATANAWNTFSDRRLKKDFSLIDDPLGKLGQLNGYYYYWKNGSDKSKQVGVVAQEVEKVLPEVVKTNNAGIKSVEYSKLSALLIEAVKSIYAKVMGHEMDIAALKSKVENLEQTSNRAPASSVSPKEFELLQSENAELKARVDKADQENAKIKAYLCAKDASAPICK